MESKPGTQSSRLLYYLLLVQFLAQFFTFFYLYFYVARIEFELHELLLSKIDGNDPEVVRRKRSSSLGGANDNTVNEASGKLDDLYLVADDNKIPFANVDSFCRRTRQYCPAGQTGHPGPAGPPGMIGIPGLKGDRGLPGLRGPVGQEGPVGFSGLPGVDGIPGTKGEQGERGLPGLKGSKGDMGLYGVDGVKGEKGDPGLDGRDGLPGGPGLDGLPGRSGRDGIPGQDGQPGLDGKPGEPGTNGINGRDGSPGPKGPAGVQGPVGQTGPRGYPGMNGTPGTPGVLALVPPSFKINGSIRSEDLLIAPSIAGSSQIQFVVVDEGVNVRLQCGASGNPRPLVQWHRQGGSTIYAGRWQDTAFYGMSLNISMVHRDDMGNYTCTAENGIPPSVSKVFKLDVRFGPLIRLRVTISRGRNQANVVTLECEVEAFPKPEVHWEYGDARIDVKPDKYRQIVNESYGEHEPYKMKLRLRILKFGPRDSGNYYCIARNSVNATKGVLRIPSDVNDKNIPETGQAVFGTLPPQRVVQKDLCALQLNCNACPRSRCAFPEIEARPMENLGFSRMPSRALDGVLEAVGIALLKGQMNDSYGVWMMDSSPKTESVAGRLWVTRKDNTSYLFEYNDIEDFSREIPLRNIRLPYGFQGNGHVVNNGYFFYNPINRSSVIRLDLSKGGSLEMNLPGLQINPYNYLYTFNHNFNYVDFDVDENGLWVIYGTGPSNTVVMKVDPVTMTPQYAWNITVDHHKYGEMFIARGVLYAVHGVTDVTMTIGLALDLYRGKQLDVHLSITNAYQKVTMLRYNSRTKELYAWSKGSLLAYQVKYRELEPSGTV